ncbi:hypothetical protein MLD38_034271 [Melastoma candidum]|uniref:Uncharacterized protein n=1 Tax=Melastoma candidum TaxID=119954 RepID=A0ACB9M9Y7_9MYRT|nr:hypothetical protein MLD38_034271 [Melastoma candidum]
MEFLEATSKVFDRIRKVDPENVTKIMGYLLLQLESDKEMIRLALGPDAFIWEAIVKAKGELQELALRSASPQMAPASVANHLTTPDHFHAASFWRFPFRVPSQCRVLPGIMSRNLSPEYVSYADSALEIVRQGGQCFALEDPELPDGATPAGQHHRMRLPDFLDKTSHYFNSGYCRHGSNCKYLHEQFMGKGYLFAHDDHVFSPGSLEKLEMEIEEILRSRRGNPLPIASLPMIYYDKYGKVLQGEGYLTESQRHGKSGHSLTRLLSRLRSIYLIDRPHGQHAVILAEDALKYMESQNEKDNHCQANSKSRQIYLTFPAESTFTEEDVSGYFNNYGQVEDVIIPCQNKRMFGFVTFVDSDTANMILAKGNPHFVCGDRVLVKPYKKKSKFIER